MALRVLLLESPDLNLKKNQMTCCDCVCGRERVFVVICRLYKGPPVPVHSGWDSTVTRAKCLFPIIIRFSKRSHQRCAGLFLNTMLSLGHAVNVWIWCRVFWFWAYPVPGFKLWSLERFASLPSKSACWAAFIIPQTDTPDLELQIKRPRETRIF